MTCAPTADNQQLRHTAVHTGAFAPLPSLMRGPCTRIGADAAAAARHAVGAAQAGPGATRVPPGRATVDAALTAGARSIGMNQRLPLSSWLKTSVLLIVRMTSLSPHITD
jgi:hypothetical protein